MRLGRAAGPVEGQLAAAVVELLLDDDELSLLPEEDDDELSLLVLLEDDELEELDEPPRLSVL